jgi:glycosyltransferase involved in cell wall biosynthesis
VRILYLCGDLGIPLDGTKGAAAHVRGMVRAFQALGHEVVVVSPGVAPDSSLGTMAVPVRVPEIADAISDAVERRLARALGHLWMNAAVEEALRRVVPAHRPDLIYERLSPFGAAGALLARRWRVPLVLEANAPLAWEGARYRHQALREPAAALEQAALAGASRIVAVSRELADLFIADGVPAAKITVIPNGVEGELFTPSGEVWPDAPSDALVLGFAGSLKPWHGVTLMAEAFRRLADDARLHLLVLGEGPESRAVAALADEHPGRVTRVGAVEHAAVPRYLRAMDIALAPYPELERFYYSPLKVLEYMATGRAVVASRIGQVTELVRHERTGLLTPPGDVDALVGAVRRLAGDAGLRRRLGLAAAAEAHRRHDWTHRAAEIVGLAEAVA